MAFYASGTSVQLPVRAESAAAASTACGFRPSPMDGRGAFAVRRAAGKENRRSGTARSAPGASGTLHPSNCPGGEHGLRLQTVTNGRTRSLCRASRSRERESSQWNRPERAGREWYVRWCAASVQLPGRRARLAASGRSQWTDAKTFREPRSRGRESSQWNRPERAGREWYAASVQLPGRRVRLQAVLNGRTRRLSVRRAAGKVRDTRDGVLRLRHIRPVVRADGIRGGEHGLRLQAVICGRTRSLIVRRAAGKGIAAVESPGTRRAQVVCEAVRCIRPIARAANAVCGFRPSSMDGRGALSCVAQPGKRIVAVEPPGTRRARVVRCIRPIARAGSTACGFRPFSMDGREAFP